MVNRTSNNSLPLPAHGSFEDTWGVDVFNNDMTDKLEVKVPVRDIDSNLSNYTPHNGAKFEATDTEAVYYGDGTTWNQASTLGQDPTFNSVTASSNLTSNGGASITGGDLSLGTVTDALVDLDSSSATADENAFYAEFVDNATTGAAPTIRWLRDASNGHAFKVTDTTNVTDILTVNDDSTISLHGSAVHNADVIYSGSGINGNINFTSRDINTGGGTWAVHDTANASDVIRFKEGTGVEVVSGGLTVSAGGLTINTSTTLGGNLDAASNNLTNLSDLDFADNTVFVSSSPNETGKIKFWNDYLGEGFMVFDNSASNVNLPQGLKSKGNPVPYSSTGTEYDIQKNGTDGAGVINFKT